MKIRKKTYSAYFTIEASFIIPIALFLLALILQLGFFCYEKSISLQCCYLAALRASNEWQLSEREMENYAKEQLKKLLKERNLYPVKRESRANATLLRIEVEVDSYMEILYSQEIDGIPDEWEWKEKKNAGRMIPSTYIRQYHTFKKAGGEKNGSNQ